MAEQRKNYRRYEDRRCAVMLGVYETLFEYSSGTERDRRLLEVIHHDYQSDAVVFVGYEEAKERDQLHVSHATGSWESRIGTPIEMGAGFDVLKALQKDAPGALTFTRVKRPALFRPADWDDLWDGTLDGSARSLLSVPILKNNEICFLIWVLQSSYSREWSSRDRAISEEIAGLLSNVADRRF